MRQQPKATDESTQVWPFCHAASEIRCFPHAAFMLNASILQPCTQAFIMHRNIIGQPSFQVNEMCHIIRSPKWPKERAHHLESCRNCCDGTFEGWTASGHCLL
jgi:hypothetical protein